MEWSVTSEQKRILNDSILHANDRNQELFERENRQGPLQQSNDSTIIRARYFYLQYDSTYQRSGQNLTSLVRNDQRAKIAAAVA